MNTTTTTLPFFSRNPVPPEVIKEIIEYAERRLNSGMTDAVVADEPEESINKSSEKCNFSQNGFCQLPTKNPVPCNGREDSDNCPFWHYVIPQEE